MQEKFLTALGKFGNLKYMIVLRGSMVIAIFGSIFMIIDNLSFGNWSKIIAPIQPQLQIAVNMTFGLLALIVASRMNYEASKANRLNELTGTAGMDLSGLFAWRNATLAASKAVRNKKACPRTRRHADCYLFS